MRLLLVGAAGLLLLAGCADDGGDAVATTTTAEPAPVSSTVTTTTLDPADAVPADEPLDIDREFSPDSEAEALGPIGATETTIKTAEGEVSIGGGDLPELAADLPLPDGFEIQIVTEVPDQAGFSGRVDGELADLVAFYETALPEAGYEIVDRQEVPGVLAVFAVTGPLTGDIVISDEPGGDGWTILVGLGVAA